jgi:predicted DNA-binding transcriptional regulator AlpA
MPAPARQTCTNVELLTAKAAEKLLDVPPSTLANWRLMGCHKIPFLKIGRNVRYRCSDLLAWMDAHTYQSTAAE